MIDASEFMHAIYDDLAQINEMLSLNDPSLSIEGTALFFNAFEVVSSLELVYLQALTRAANFHGFLERTYVDAEKVIVDTFTIEEARYGIVGDVGSGDSSLSEDEKYVSQFISSEPPPISKKQEARLKARKKKRAKEQEEVEVPGVPGAEQNQEGLQLGDEMEEDENVE